MNNTRSVTRCVIPISSVGLSRLGTGVLQISDDLFVATSTLCPSPSVLMIPLNTLIDFQLFLNRPISFNYSFQGLTSFTYRLPEFISVVLCKFPGFLQVLLTYFTSLSYILYFDIYFRPQSKTYQDI